MYDILLIASAGHVVLEFFPSFSRKMVIVSSTIIAIRGNFIIKYALILLNFGGSSNNGERLLQNSR